MRLASFSNQEKRISTTGSASGNAQRALGIATERQDGALIQALRARIAHYRSRMALQVTASR
jgi:hypothetical protein